MTCAQSKDAKTLESTLESIEFTTEIFVNHARGNRHFITILLNSSISDVASAASASIINNNCSEIQSLQKEISETATAIVQLTADPEAPQQLLQLLHQQGDRFQQLENSTNQAIISGIKEMMCELNNHKTPGRSLQQLCDAASSGKVDTFEKTKQDFLTKSYRLIEFIDRGSVLCKDSESFRKLRSCQEELKAMAKEVTIAARAVCANSKDGVLNEYCDAIVKVWEDRMKDIQDTVFEEETVFKASDILAVKCKIFEV
jgi:hypothetical protein